MPGTNTNSKAHRKNSYDFIRFIAASMVVLSHSYVLLGFGELRFGSSSFGELGVWIFFILSGFLIATSWDQYPRFVPFMIKRTLRIFPALIVVVLLSTFGVGLIFTTLSTLGYLTHPATISYLNNILLYNTQFVLPGVFETNPYPHTINGSLWTLAYEFTMYLGVVALGTVGILKKINTIYVWLAFLFAEAIIKFSGLGLFDFSIFYLRFDTFVTLGLMFMTGVLYHKKYRKLPLSVPYGVMALGLFIFVPLFVPQLTVFLACTLLAYAIFALGSQPLMHKFGKYGDFSYGIYIYSFPVQQIIAATLLPHSPWIMFALALPISVLLGYISWTFIESKALSYKSKINLHKYPLATQADESW